MRSPISTENIINANITMSKLLFVELSFKDILAKSELWSNTGTARPYALFDLLTKELCPVFKANFRAVRITLGDLLQEISGGGEVFDYEVPFDLNEFVRLGENERNEWMLCTIERTLVYFSSKIGVSADLIRSSALVVRENAFKWKGYIGKGRGASPDKARQAKLWLEFGNQAIIYLHITRDKLLTDSVELFRHDVTARGWYSCMFSEFNRIEWENDENLLILTQASQHYRAYNTLSKTLEFHFPRAESGDPQGEYHLAQIYIAGNIVAKDMEKALYWMRLAASKGDKHAIKYLKIQKGSGFFVE